MRTSAVVAIFGWAERVKPKKTRWRPTTIAYCLTGCPLARKYFTLAVYPTYRIHRDYYTKSTAAVPLQRFQKLVIEDTPSILQRFLQHPLQQYGGLTTV